MTTDTEDLLGFLLSAVCLCFQIEFLIVSPCLHGTPSNYLLEMMSLTVCLA
jgi:hypothetical protein